MNEYLRSKSNVQIKKRGKKVLFLLRDCAQCLAFSRPTGKPSEVEYFHSSLTISTLLHVAIMRDKALSNEQLHVVRTVPITNHCV